MSVLSSIAFQEIFSGISLKQHISLIRILDSREQYHRRLSLVNYDPHCNSHITIQSTVPTNKKRYYDVIDILCI